MKWIVISCEKDVSYYTLVKHNILDIIPDLPILEL